MASLQYIVVEFEKEVGSGVTSVEVVPETWRDTEGHRCFLYPAHYTDNRILKAARKGEPPTDQWKSYPVSREWLTTDSWEKANRRCDKITITSNPSDTEGEEGAPKKRQRRLPARYEEAPQSQDLDHLHESDIDSLDESSSDEVSCVSSNLPEPPASNNFKGRTLFAKRTRRLEEASTSGQSATPKGIFQRTQRKQVLPMTSVTDTPSQDHTLNERMFTLLEKVIERLDRNEQLLLQIAERQQIALPVDAEVEEETVLPPLPCQSKEALQELNTLLENSHAARKKLTRTLSLVGGTGQAVCGNSLKKIVGHEVSKTYNLMGTKGKSSFAELRSLHAVVKKGIRANKGMGDTTDKDISNWAGRWFTNARDRNGDRKARLAETMQEAPARNENN